LICHFSLTILLILSPILVAPKLGLIFGYLRVRLVDLMGFFMHALHNAVLLVLIVGYAQ
jgi:hypothetical protein